MKPFPFPIRFAAGLAVTTAQRAREMPKQLAGLPVTMFSQVLQASMRVQQNITELAIKGDDALAALRPVDEAPSWATFDEDLADAPGEQPAVLGTVTPLDTVPRNGRQRQRSESDAEDDPWAEEERALARDYAEGTFDSPQEPSRGSGTGDPAGVRNYDELTLPQLRARLRQFSAAQLEELLAYERANANRSSFTGMLARRIDNVGKEGDAPPGQDASEQ